MVSGDLACGDGTLGFSKPVVSSSGVESYPFISSLTLLGSTRVILVIYTSWGSFSSCCMSLWSSSSNNIPILCAFVAYAALFSSLSLRASWAICSIVSTCSSILIALNLVMFGLSFLCITSSQSRDYSINIWSSKLSCAYGQQEETCDTCWRTRTLWSCLRNSPVGNLYSNWLKSSCLACAISFTMKNPTWKP